MTKFSYQCVLTSAVLHSIVIYCIVVDYGDVVLPTKDFWLEFRGAELNKPNDSRPLRKQKLKNYNKRQAQNLDDQLQKALRFSVTKFAEKNTVESDLDLGTQDDSGTIGDLDLQSKIYSQLWSKIRAQIDYRAEHFRSRIEGKVNLKVRVSRYGQLVRIMDEDAIGNRYLLGWVVICLTRALAQPLLLQPLNSHKILDLTFYFSLGDPLPPDQNSSQNLSFSIYGDIKKSNLISISQNTNESSLLYGLTTELVSLRMSFARIKNIFEDKKITNRLDWDFYAKQELLTDYCERFKNQEACKLLADQYKAMGKQDQFVKYSMLAKKR
ncbi:MAG: hypothetical protein H6623_06645 [Bdellovibrionaceae bacterium]|nr:hypothetical protein [Pseudobdellovibrionaceae bacterium]